MDDPVCIVVTFNDEVMPTGSVGRIHTLRRLRNEGVVVTRYYKDHGVLTGVVERATLEEIKKAFKRGSLGGAVEIDLVQNADPTVAEGLDDLR